MENSQTTTLQYLFTIPHIAKSVFAYLGRKNRLYLNLVCKQFYKHNKAYLSIIEKSEHKYIGELSKDVYMLILLGNFVWNIDKEVIKDYTEQCEKYGSYSLQIFPS